MGSTYETKRLGKGLFVNTDQSKINNGLSALSTSETPKILFTINHVDKKLKGFIDFDLQINRPDIPKANAHDQRFEPYNMFPPNFSKTQQSRIINFDNYQSRDSMVYYAKMSDPLFDH